jgi:hypothetical protein
MGELQGQQFYTQQFVQASLQNKLKCQPNELN